MLRPDDDRRRAVRPVPIGNVAPESRRRTPAVTRPTPSLDLADRAGQEVGLADEVGDEPVGRLVVDVPGRADLQDLARRHDRDAVGHGQRLFLVVRDEDEGDAGLVLHALELDLHLLAQLVVERRQRLVEQQHLGAGRERARQRDALRLAAGNLVGAAARRVPPYGPASALPRHARPISPFGLPSICRPKATFSATVRCGNSA